MTSEGICEINSEYEDDEEEDVVVVEFEAATGLDKILKAMSVRAASR